jgi:tetratricopeptide (TPR) repeat protein
VHPLRVESVAWVAERKDVLSAFFWLAAMLAWLRYVRRPGLGRYALVAAFMALGLTAKAILVTLPAALLLLDCWPLGRFRPGPPGLGRPEVSASGAPWRRLGVLALEKLPLLALSAAVAATALITQSRTLQPLDSLPPLQRVARALTSYAAYLGDTLVPRKLAFFYPLREVPAGEALAAALLLAAITGLAVRRARRSPWLPFGWLWFLGVLVPVTGIAQVGAQARADRYTYIPSIGLAIAAVWGIAELVGRRPRLRPVAAAGAAAAILLLAAATRGQVATWRDSETLFRHAAEVTEDNYLAHLNLAGLLGRRGEREEAAAHFQAALRAAPDNPEVLGGAAEALVVWGRPLEALPYLARAIDAAPDDPRLHHTSAIAFEALGDDGRAIEHLRHATRLDPGFAAAHHGLGELLLRRGDRDGALAALRAALAADPGRLALYPVVAELLAERGRDDEAAAYREAEARLRALAAAAAPPGTDTGGRATIPPRSAP